MKRRVFHPRRHPITVLCAGFSAFPGAPLNPTEALARSLDGATAANGETIDGLVLPVEWEGAFPALKAAIAARRPSAVVLFGLHARAGRIRIETMAHNARELGRADAAGGFPSGPAVTEGPERLEARLPLGRVVAGLRAEAIDFELSRDAGRYLCNDTLYRLCLHGEASGLGAYGFVHVPLTDEVVEAWASAGTLPELCRTLPAAVLKRAALAICGALAGEDPVA